MIEVVPRDAIMCNVRLEWTFEEFWADGGTTKFADRMAGALGIHASNVKVVSVYKGSVGIEYVVDLEEKTDLNPNMTETEKEELIEEDK